MKRNLYIIALLTFAATAFTGCSHDYNYDGEYDVPGYFSGSDPRNNLVYFSTNTVDYTNSFVGDLLFSEAEHTFMLQATINRNLTKATKVQVAYAKDAPLLATTYKDYQVATDADFTLTNGGAFEIGTETTQMQIPVTVKNMGKFTKPTVIPVRITPSDEALKSPKSSRDYAYIVIKQEELWTVYAGSSDITVNLEGTNNKYIGEDDVTVWFTVAKAFTGKGKVGLERDNSLFKSDGTTKLAPEGISAVEKQDVEGEVQIATEVQLSHAEKFTAKGTYILPMRAIYYDEKGNKHYITGGNIFLSIKVMDISIAHSSTAPTGTEIPATQLIINSSRELAYGTITSLTDGVIDNQYTYLSKGTTDITIDLTQKETVKGVQLGMFISNRYPYYPESVKFYGSNNGTDWDELSTDMYIPQKKLNNFNAIKNVSVRYLKLEFNVTKRWGSLTEIKVFK
ncbi:carbohydrate-binding protein [Prevotella sp. HMSC077E09]|uniref:discoidin domain-containing protein n=1 Tax=Prevotella sp. HMSC077E09 TaxID=1739487 RepID=UPI0008A2B153|nr:MULTISPECIES: discoidin domain-containing protein [unclassified Prevotella]OFO72345.1 carbohydrate-binding protein [Prevotella sp. HMSC077E08]OFP53416.1 carbohydrate-binding protein [Prevotella sp. HMSC077E09]